MRKAILLAAVLVACSKGETPPADTAAAMAPAPPANLTSADLAGSWNGTSKAAGTDSVVNTWVAVQTSDTTLNLTLKGMTKPVAMAVRLDADSMIATSVAFVPPGPKTAPKVVIRSIGRLQNGELVGTAVTMLAAKPDSVISRRTYVATKAP